MADDDVGDEIVAATAHLSAALRAWLRARREPPEAIAAAVAWELAAFIALHCATIAQAHAVVDAWTLTMKDQISECGVGPFRPHP